MPEFNKYVPIPGDSPKSDQNDPWEISDIRELPPRLLAYLLDNFGSITPEEIGNESDTSISVPIIKKGASTRITTKTQYGTAVTFRGYKQGDENLSGAEIFNPRERKPIRFPKRG